MSDLVKILVFSLFLSILWVIPRFDLILSWITSHIWQFVLIGAVIISCFLIFNKIISKRAQKVQQGQLETEKSEG
ncbi:hypothetical protein JCM9140_879 [Halalkalibacter wakoensis JCM 9140]|uniref:Uncharacterized protein n=1 Tax=Halalkalibacter wakoensis JCM 9140 TaxID=1236970 RepID=W4PZ36_9BACI|nr:hypothetical protein [Halalkalibacter wakoensis]GAE24915.1 hypothetical protein JCM9140_879 [Halalkalibacter wakoensis JCM 9140]